MIWTDEKVAELRRMWPHHTGAEIAAYFRVSRNSVLSAVKRFDVSKDASNAPTPKPRAVKAPPVGSTAFKVIDGIKRAKKREQQPTLKAKLFQCREADVEPLHLSLADVTGCRWPYGEQPPFTFCGHPQFQGLSYCAQHARLSMGQGTTSERKAHHVSRRVA